MTAGGNKNSVQVVAVSLRLNIEGEPTKPRAYSSTPVVSSNVPFDGLGLILPSTVTVDDTDAHKSITLTEEHIYGYFLLGDASDASKTVYDVIALPAGIRLDGTTDQNGTATFTHQDVLDGKITLTIINPDDISGTSFQIKNNEDTATNSSNEGDNESEDSATGHSIC